MKPMTLGRLASLLFAGLVCSASAGDLTIQSFDASGRLSFAALNNRTNYVYRVEWAPSATGPWTNFTGAAAVLDAIQAAGGQMVTCSVPMCYRVMAMAQGFTPTVTTSNAAGYQTGGPVTLNGAANPNGTSATGWFRYSTENPGMGDDTSGTRVPPSGGTALGAGSSAVPFS